MDNKFPLCVPISLKELSDNVCSELLVEARYLRKYKQYGPKEVVVLYTDKDVYDKITCALNDGIKSFKEKVDIYEGSCPLIEIDLSKFESIHEYCLNVPKDGNEDLYGLTLKEYQVDRLPESIIKTQEIRDKIFKIRNDSKNKYYEYFNTGVLYIHGSLNSTVIDYIKSTMNDQKWPLVPTTWVVYANMSELDEKQEASIVNFIGKESIPCKIDLDI